MLTAIENYLHYLKAAKNYSDNTIEAYRNDLMNLVKFIREELKVEPAVSGLNRQLFKNYLRRLLAEKSAKKTYNRHLSAIKSFSRYLLKNDLTKTDYSLNLHALTLDERLPKYVPLEDMAKIISQLMDDDFLHSREKFIVEMFYDTGIRLSEMLNIRVNDLNLFERMVSVVGKGRKQRIIPFSLHLPPTINNYLSKRSEVMKDSGFDHDYMLVSVKGARITNRHVQRIIQKVLEKIATLTQTSPHVLRHSFATHMLDLGADIKSVSTLLGHESLSTTQIYTHLSMEKLKNIYEQAHPKS